MYRRETDDLSKVANNQQCIHIYIYSLAVPLNLEFPFLSPRLRNAILEYNCKKKVLRAPPTDC